MAVTTFANMQIVPDKFTEYTLDRSTELNTMVNAGVATGDKQVAKLIDGTPKGGNMIQMPHYKALEGEDEVFGEYTMEPSEIKTGSEYATLLVRQKSWGASDLSEVMGGDDPMGAVTDLVGDWWNEREQAIYLSILKGILDPTAGCLKDHVNNISTMTAAAALIGVDATLDTKQALGDHANKLGMTYMHSATYTYLQKLQKIETVFDSDLKVNIQTYLGYRVSVDDAMPVNGDVFTTYFLGQGAFAREFGMPQGLVGTEADRDSLGSEDILINRRAMVIHPRGCSFNKDAITDAKKPYATNAMLSTAANWTLAKNHKNVPVAALVHKIG